MKTSYYQSKKLDPRKHLIVQTSNGEPRFGTQPEWESEFLIPPPALVAKAKRGEVNEFAFYKEYAAHLETIGVEKIREEIIQLKVEAAKPATVGCLEIPGPREIVLCCFEALHKPGQFCHRRMFASWWEKQTGQKIEEL